MNNHLDISHHKGESPAKVYLESLGIGSQRTMEEALALVSGWLASAEGLEVDYLHFPWWELRYPAMIRLRKQLAEAYKPNTGNKILSAVKGVLKASWRMGFMNAEDYQRAIDIPIIKGETLPRGRGLAPAEIGALMRVCSEDNSNAGYRDAAMIALMYATGLRRSEVVSLDVTDYEGETGRLLVREGKGSKERINFINNGAQDAMADWLRVRGDAPGALFLAINKSDRIVYSRKDKKAGEVIPGRMVSTSVYDILETRAEQAGVSKFSPHDFRRTTISDLLDAGADLLAVSKQVGHSDPSTTGKYDKRGERALQKNAKLLHVPYSRRKTVL